MTYWLLEIALRGLIAAGLGSLVVAALYRATATTRALLWAGLLAGLLALAPANVLLPRWEIPILAPQQTGQGVAESLSRPDVASEGAGRSAVDRAAVSPDSATGVEGDRTPRDPRGLSRAGDLASGGTASSPRQHARQPDGTGLALSRSTSLPDAAMIAVLLWLTMSTALLIRLLLGVVGARRLQRRAAPMSDPAVRRQLQALSARAGVAPAPDLLHSPAVSIPVAVHLGRPAILVPEGFEAWGQRQRASVLLHELAHLRRYDCWVQLLARAAVALHWFNPLAWLAASRLWLERERACDDFVIRAGLRPSDYAGDLLAVANRAVPAPVSAAVAFARNEHLAPRVRAILSSHNNRRSPRWSTLMTLPALLLIFLLPAAAAFPVAVAPEPPPVSAGTPPGVTTAAAPAATPASRPLPQVSRPSIDDLVRMRIHGVSPEFIAAMSEITGPLEIDRLIEFRIHGVQAELVRAAREAFGEDATAEQIVKMRIHGLSPASITGIRSLLPHQTVGVEDLVRLRIHGVDEEMIRELQEAGYDDLTVDELVKIRIHGLAETMKRRSGGSR